MFVFSVQDVLIKLLSENTSLFQILFFRAVLGIFFILLYLKATGQPIKFGTAYPVLSLARGVLFFVGYSTFYFALSKIAIANATVLFLVGPFFITIMSIIVFGSHVSYKRWITMLVGFSGVLFIARPEMGQINIFYFLPVTVALIYGISMIITKLTAEKDTVFQQMIVMYFITAVLSGIAGLVMGDGSWISPERAGIQFMTHAWQFGEHVTLLTLLGISIVGTFGFLLLHSAYRIADPAIVSPFEYTGLLPAIIFGYLFWDDIPAVNELIGMSLIVGAGIYLLYRERVSAQKAAFEAALQPVS